MAGSNVPKNIADVLESFKAQSSASRPRSGVGNRNYFLQGPRDFMLDDDTRAVRTRLSFDTSSIIETTETTMDTSILISANKRPNDSMISNADVKRVALSSPSTSEIWSPVSKEKRSKLLESLNSRITDLQTLVSKNEEFKKDLMDVMKHEKQTILRQRDRELESVRSLKEELRMSKRSLQELETKHTALEEKFTELSTRKRKEVAHLENDMTNLEVKWRSARNEADSNTLDMDQQIERHKKEISLVESKNTQLESQIHELQTKLFKLQERHMHTEMYQQQLAVAKQRIQTLEKEMGTLNDKLKKQDDVSSINMGTTHKVKKLEEQLAQSTELLRGKLMMEEQLSSLQVKLNSMSHLPEQVANLQELNKKKETELLEWHTFACKFLSDEDTGISPITPRKMNDKFQELEQLLLVTKADLNDKNIELKNITEKYADVNTRLSSVNALVNKFKSTIEDNTNNIKKLERKLFLVTKERDSLQAVLTAYEGDVTFTGPLQMEALQRARVESAETSVQELRKLLDDTEKELAVHKGDSGTSSANLTSLQLKIEVQQTEVEKEKNRNKSLEERCEKLEMLLEQRALRGDYDPSSTKVLHLRLNPMSEIEESRVAQINTLKESNDKLRERVKILETAVTAGTSTSLLNTTAIVDENIQIQSNKEVKDLRDKVKQLETKSQRLVEMFKKTSSTFRQAIYLLLGYKTDALNDNNFRLTSRYAEHEDDHLIFKIDGDNIEMIRTDFSDTIPELIHIHIDEQNSIPTFLSALTLDLFSRSTFTS